MASKKVIAVVGATGIQGGSVVRTILADPKMSTSWRIRGVTRDVSKESAQKLSRQGVEVVEANLNDKSSLVKAFSGAYAVFGVTNYFDTMNKDSEIQQGKNLADAANEVGVKHYIWSSLIDVNKLTKGRLPNVYHFDSKAAVESYVRTLPSLPASFFLPGVYMSNIPGQSLRPSPLDNAYTLSLPVPASAPVPLFAAAEDTGKFVKAILLHREATLGRRVLGATKYYTFQEMLDIFKRVFPDTGKNAQYFEMPHEMFTGFLKSKGMPDFAAEELLENFRLLNEGGYYGGESLEWSHSLLEDKLTTWDEFIKAAKPFEGLK